MNIEFQNDQPQVIFSVLRVNGKHQPCRFLVDTGFMGTCAFTVAAQDTLGDLDLSAIKQLPRENWIGRQWRAIKNV